jgi:signal transduction histidine kinase
MPPPSGSLADTDSVRSARGEAAPARPDGGGRLGGQLLVAAGLVTFVNNYLPGGGHLNVAVLNAVSFAAIALGVVAMRLPWERWSSRLPLVLALLAFALIGLADRYGGVGNFSYAVYFVVVFVWVGLVQPPFTSLALAPLAAVAYVLPLATSPHLAPHGVASSTVAIPVCVLVGETLARSVRRQQEAQRALAERIAYVEAQRNREQAILDAVADGLLVVDAHGHVVSANAAAARLLGHPAEELVGAPVPVPTAAAPCEHQLGDGRWVESIAAPLPGTDQTVVAVHDITRQRALAEAQDLFLATTSHELRTPLTVVTGFLATLRRRWDVLDDRQRRAAVDAAGQRADSLVSLVNHLLLAARAGVHRHATSMSPFDLAAAAQRIVADHAALSATHRIDYAGEPSAVAVGDESSVEPVLGQLLENAMKYSPQGGPITVSVSSYDGTVRLEVADCGIGLPEGGDLFAPFVQGGGGDRREYAGVGLGLHIVRRLVEAQGGTVAARNREGGGAVFTVTLPRGR